MEYLPIHFLQLPNLLFDIFAPMKTTLLFFASFFFALTGMSQSSTKTISLFENKLKIDIPADVHEMNEATVKLKYHKSKDGKTFFYADDDASFSFAVSTIAEKVKETDMVKHKDEFTAKLGSGGFKPESNEVKIVNGHSLLVIAFYSEVPGGKVYNKKVFGVTSGKLFMIAFNCTEGQLAKRLPEIESAINSIHVK